MDYTYVDIVFTKSRKKINWGSKAIMAWTGVDYSHVACGITVSDWGMNYFQASEGKVNYEHEPYFKAKHEVVKRYRLKLPKSIARELKQEFYQNSGAPYAYLQNVGIALIDLFKRFTGKTLPNPWTKGKNCSELIYDVLVKRLKPDLDVDPNKVKPHEIEQLLIDNFSEYIEVTIIGDVWDFNNLQ